MIFCARKKKTVLVWHPVDKNNYEKTILYTQSEFYSLIAKLEIDKATY